MSLQQWLQKLQNKYSLRVVQNGSKICIFLIRVNADVKMKWCLYTIRRGRSDILKSIVVLPTHVFFFQLYEWVYWTFSHLWRWCCSSSRLHRRRQNSEPQTASKSSASDCTHWSTWADSQNRVRSLASCSVRVCPLVQSFRQINTFSAQQKW